jgi:hypothetical protein
MGGSGPRGPHPAAAAAAAAAAIRSLLSLFLSCMAAEMMNILAPSLRPTVICTPAFALREAFEHQLKLRRTLRVRSAETYFCARRKTLIPRLMARAGRFSLFF